MRPPEIFETERLILRVPAFADAKSIFANYSQDAEVTRYLTWRPHQNIQQTERFVAQCIIAWEGANRFPWVIGMKSKNKAVGMLELRINGFKAEMGYVLAREYWGQGIMPDAARQVTDWALSQPEIYRVWAVCDVENAASARVLEKIRMQREGLLHRYIIHPNLSDEPRDVYCYAVVK